MDRMDPDLYRGDQGRKLPSPFTPAINEEGTFAASTSSMSDTHPCPNCRSAITYPTGTSWMCGECGHEWNPEELAADELAAEQAAGPAVVKDSNGNILQDGDDVIVIKDLPVKGAPKAIKA